MGVCSLSEPEARALMDTVTTRTNIVAAMTLHTYTGALLTQPYNPDTDLPKSDIAMLQGLAEQLVAGTGYKVFRVHPDFTYDPKQSICCMRLSGSLLVFLPTLLRCGIHLNGLVFR